MVWASVLSGVLVCWWWCPAPTGTVGELPPPRPAPCMPMLASVVVLWSLVGCGVGGACWQQGGLVPEPTETINGLPPPRSVPGGCCRGWVLGGWNGVVVGAHRMLRSLCLVAGHVDVMKHLLLATRAPTSAKYCRERFIPLTAVEACFILLAYRKRSSASTLGSTWWALMHMIHGRMSRATSAIEKGQPCGMEHLCWCGVPMAGPIWLYTTSCC